MRKSVKFQNHAPLRKYKNSFNSLSRSTIFAVGFIQLTTFKSCMIPNLGQQEHDVDNAKPDDHRAAGGGVISASLWSSTPFHMSTGPGRHQCKQSLPFLIHLLSK